MSQSEITICYIIGAILFILSLGGLSKQETARRGNWYGIIGMLLALIAVTASEKVTDYGLLSIALVPAIIIGWILARKVQMTGMPQLVAILHSFVGLAAVLVGLGLQLDPNSITDLSPIEVLIHEIEVFVGVCIGSITFTGSIIAYAKLDGKMSGKPLILPARHILNLIALFITIWLGYEFTGHHDSSFMYLLISMVFLMMMHLKK